MVMEGRVGQRVSEVHYSCTIHMSFLVSMGHVLLYGLWLRLFAASFIPWHTFQLPSTHFPRPFASQSCSQMPCLVSASSQLSGAVTELVVQIWIIYHVKLSCEFWL